MVPNLLPSIVTALQPSHPPQWPIQSVAVVGLGYVGLPLAVEFGQRIRTIGFDTNEAKVQACQRGQDPSQELSATQMAAATWATYTVDAQSLATADVIIVAVPTPVDSAHNPDFSPLINASRSIGQHMKAGVTVVYESTVYPGATEEICIPELEKSSGKQWKRDFSVGYSPERINPGDPDHTLTQIKKVVRGDTPDTLSKVAALYEWIIQPGVYQASSIRAAEAAKVIENTQRDLNIALMNELAILFKKLQLDTSEVLAAASTKWNFMPFKPGLVGGHCIGVDPYYLTHKAEQLGYHPQVILAGRRINDSMGPFIAEQTIKQMITHGLAIRGAKVSIAGLTFKENCADLRNSKVVDVVTELKSYGVDIFLTDAFAHAPEVQGIYGQPLLSWNDLPMSDVFVAAVPHKVYRSMNENDWRKKIRYGGVFIDVGAAFDQKQLQQMGLLVWRL